MKQCQFCKEKNDDNIQICTCGFNFLEGQITDSTRITNWISTPDLKRNWHERLSRLQKVYFFQKENYKASKNTSIRNLYWSKRKTAKLLNKSPGGITTDLQLAEAFQKYPELIKCRNKKNAASRLKEIKDSTTANRNKLGFEYEEDLHELLEKNWEKTLFEKDWKLMSSGYDTKEIGELDMLAKHKEKNRWLVIELKKDQSSDETIGQLLRYMGFIKKEKKLSNDDIEGIIISRSTDSQILYALECTLNIKLLKYEYKGGEFEFHEVIPEVELILKQLDKLPKKIQTELLNSL